jgi:hypothetical protein
MWHVRCLLNWYFKLARDGLWVCNDQQIARCQNFYVQIEYEVNCEVGLVSTMPGHVHQVILKSTGVSLLLHDFAVTLIIQAAAYLGAKWLVGLEVREPLPQASHLRRRGKGPCIIAHPSLLTQNPWCSIGSLPCRYSPVPDHPALLPPLAVIPLLFPWFIGRLAPLDRPAEGKARKPFRDGPSTVIGATYPQRCLRTITISLVLINFEYTFMHPTLVPGGWTCIWHLPRRCCSASNCGVRKKSVP